MTPAPPRLTTVVTGGSGFLGSTIARHLLAEGHEVTIVDLVEPGSKGLPVDCAFVRGDVRDKDLLGRLFAGVDEVYHLAGVLGTAELQESTELAVAVNIAGTVNVLETALETDVARVFYPGKPNVWLNTYTITKHAAEQFAQMFNGQSRYTRICSLRYFNVYGPGQALSPIRKIVPAFAVQAMRGLPIEVYGDGEQVVDMVYSRDLAELTVRFTGAGVTDRIPDCGSGRRVTVNEVAAACNDHFGNRAGIRHLPMRPGEVSGTILTADQTELEGILGDLRLTDYRESLHDTLDWYASLDPALLDKCAAFYGWSSL
jgi:nucleoside-diphosphate-sugar epimerase